MINCVSSEGSADLFGAASVRDYYNFHMEKKMKKHFCLIWVSIIVGLLFASCAKQPVPSNGKEDIFTNNSESDDFDPNTLGDIAYYKEFLGGTGFVTESEDSSHYEYSGGVMDVDFAIHNMGRGFEGGIFLMLNGIFQEFTISAAGNTTSKYGYMNTVNIPEKEDVVMKLSFTPNTGSSGEVLGLAVGVMIEPSFTSTYSGWPRYSKYGEHGYGGVSGMTVKMNCDSVSMPSAKNITVSETEISEGYYGILTAGWEDDRKAEIWKKTHSFALYYDTYDFEKDLIVVPDTDVVDLKLDLFGKTGTYRFAVFINNNLVEIEKGSTYIEVSHTDDKVSHVVFPVDISTIPNNSHIYVIVSEYCDDKDSDDYGHFIYAEKTRTCYFIKGELPVVTTDIGSDTTESIPDEQTTANTGAPENVGNVTDLRGLDILYVSLIKGKTICFVCRDADSKNTAVYYDVETGRIINTIRLSENAKFFAVVGDTLISADNIKTTDGKYTKYDIGGNEIASFIYVDNDAAEKDSQGAFSIMNEAMTKAAVDSSNGDLIYIAGGADTYFIPCSTGVKTRLDFFSGDHAPTQVLGFTDGIILTSVTNDAGSTFSLTDIHGNRIKDIPFSNAKRISVAGRYAAIYEEPNASGVSSNNIMAVLDCITGEITEVTVETNRENQWCRVSEDGKYILTYNNDITFKLYETATSTLIKTFEIQNANVSGGLYKVFIDSINRTVYFQTSDDEGYCIQTEKF